MTTAWMQINRPWRIPSSSYNWLHPMQIPRSEFDKATCNLFIGAFFFAMRSCEYIKVEGPRKTKLLQLNNICFYKGQRQLLHSDTELPNTDCVSITFEEQKRDTKNDTITQHHSGNSLLCPVRVWASIVQRISSYPNSKPAKQVLLKHLRSAATAEGPDSLGFTASQIGLHSAHSGAAMAMYLARVPVVTIMLPGRWSSDASLCCTRKQVKEFSNGISLKMVLHEHFFTIPSSPNEDPRSLNKPLNLASRNNHGPCFKDKV
jgi:hypothetical protein